MLKRAFELVRKHIGKIALTGALTVGATVYHLFDPTLVPRLLYIMKDPFVTTATEQKIETEYRIDYEGDDDETEQKYLEQTLRQVKISNSELLKYCTKIVLHPRTVTDSQAIQPFVDFNGRAFYTGMIELTTPELSTLYHELAHTKDFQMPTEFKKKLYEIFGNSYEQGLKEPTYWYLIKRIAPTSWEDGSIKPRNGFVNPYGANNSQENVATYVEKANFLPFWETPEVQDAKYKRTLELLRQYDFITQQQYEEILRTIQTSHPDWIKQKLETAVAALETPKLVKQEYFDFGGSEEVYYQNKDIKIYRSFSPRCDNSIWIDLKTGEQYTKQFRINNTEGKLRAVTPNETIVPQTFIDKLAQTGYADLFDDVKYTAIIHPERK